MENEAFLYFYSKYYLAIYTLKERKKNKITSNADEKIYRRVCRVQKKSSFRRETLFVNGSKCMEDGQNKKKTCIAKVKKHYRTKYKNKTPVYLEKND
jgi:hypothetical protein